MCLVLKRNSKVETSPVSITVFKRLDSTGIAPYRRIGYHRGELKTVDKFTTVNYGRVVSFTKKLPDNAHVVERGLHTYATKRRAQRIGRYGLVVKCTIPRHTPFIRGTNGEIVTLKLRVGEAVSWSWDDSQWNKYTEYASYFNSRGREK